MTINAYTGVTFNALNIPQTVQDLVTLANNLLTGKANVAVEFTPAAATTSTVVTDVRLTPNSILMLEATTLTGATQLAGGGMYITAADRGSGTCTVTHTTGAASQLFRLVIWA